MSRKPVPERDVEKIRELVKAGISLKMIAERFGISVTTVRHYSKDLQKKGRRGDCIHYLESPDGERYVVSENTVDFAKQHGLTHSCFLRIGTPEGVRKGLSHKGWKAYKPYEYVPVKNKAPNNNQLDPFIIFEIEAFAESGYTIDQIAAKLDISPVTAQKYVNRFRMRKYDDIIGLQD